MKFRVFAAVVVVVAVAAVVVAAAFAVVVVVVVAAVDCSAFPENAEDRKCQIRSRWSK